MLLDWHRANSFLNPKRIHYAWPAGGAMWFVWLFSILLGPGNMDLANQVVGTDYVQFYAAGRTIHMGESEQLYDFEYQSELERELIGPELGAYHAFINPPFLAWLYTPLSVLPYTFSYAIWCLLGLFGVWLSLRWLGYQQPRKPFLWALTWFPIFASISFGQNSLLSLTLLSLTYFLWSRKYSFLAGLVSSFLLYKPQLVIGIGLLWLLHSRYDWKALLGLSLGGCFLASLSFVFMPEASQAYLHFARTVLPVLPTLPTFPLYHAHTIQAFWLLLFKQQVPLVTGLTLLLASIFLAAFILFYWKQRNQPDVLFAGAVCLTVLVSPHAMIYDWSLLLIPAVLLWNRLPERQEYWRVLFALVWVSTYVSSVLTRVQMELLPVAVQVSVPFFVFVLANAMMLLNRWSDMIRLRPDNQTEVADISI